MDKIITNVGSEYEYLTKKVSLYEFSPKGAEYYVKLQELILSRADALEAYHEYKKSPTMYQLKTYLICIFIWPYYLFGLVFYETK